jgi:anti-sigma factor RsiW
MSLDPNDPKLTAYALGELDDTERVAIEAELAESADARRTVEEILRTAALLEQELQMEPPLALSEDQRKAIETEAAKSNGAWDAQAPDGWHAKAPDGWHAQAPAQPGRRHVE